LTSFHVAKIMAGMKEMIAALLLLAIGPVVG
jgi:hypothetical protein